MNSQNLSLQKKLVKSVGQVSRTLAAASNPFWDKADFKFSPFYRKGLIEVRQLQVSQLVRTPAEQRFIEHLPCNRGLIHIIFAR